MNTEKSKAYKFNIMDTLIVVLLIICLISVFLRAFEIKNVTSGVGLEEYTINFKVENIRSSSLEYFVSGDSVRIKQSNKILGTLEGVAQHLPAVGAYTDDGREVFYPDIESEELKNETRYSLVGSITVRGKMTDGGFLLNGDTYLAPNSVLHVVTEHVETDIKIIGIFEK